MLLPPKLKTAKLMRKCCAIQQDSILLPPACWLLGTLSPDGQQELQHKLSGNMLFRESCTGSDHNHRARQTSRGDPDWYREWLMISVQSSRCHLDNLGAQDVMKSTDMPRAQLTQELNYSLIYKDAMRNETSWYIQKSRKRGSLVGEPGGRNIIQKSRFGNLKECIAQTTNGHQRASDSNLAK